MLRVFCYKVDLFQYQPDGEHWLQIHRLPSSAVTVISYQSTPSFSSPWLLPPCSYHFPAGMPSLKLVLWLLSNSQLKDKFKFLSPDKKQANMCVISFAKFYYSFSLGTHHALSCLKCLSVFYLLYCDYGQPEVTSPLQVLLHCQIKSRAVLGQPWLKECSPLSGQCSSPGTTVCSLLEESI